MRVNPLLLFAFFSLSGAVFAQDGALTRIRQLEAAGDSATARAELQAAVRRAPGDVAALTAWAEFLDCRKDPETRQAYEKLLASLPDSADPRRRAAVARRLVLLDMIAGDQTSAARHLDVYRSAGGDGLTPPPSEKASAEIERRATIAIPGPIRSFARMAALSPDLNAEDLLGALARNIVTNGYQASGGAEGLDQTEYLKLVVRYLSQARELEKLAGAEKVIKIETCESTQTADLLRVLGYRMRGACGSEVVLETVNASRAFLTIDSGFPLAEFEQALRTNRPFVYDYKSTHVPVLFGSDYWLSTREKQQGEFIDAFLADPSICRLYLGMSKLDPETAAAIREGIPVQRVRAFAHVLDFFGGMFRISGGKAQVPGSAKAWADIVGAAPDNGVAFFERLISRDDGWMASYFDALARMNGPVRDYLTQPERMKRFYAALRGRITSPGPARPVFRSNTDLMLLTTRLRLAGPDKPHVPGSLDVWRNLFVNHPHGKYDGKLTRAASGWKEPDDVVEALFALCRKAVENEPLKIFMTLTDLERNRAKPLQTATVDRLAREYRRFGAQYPIFAESSDLSDQSILLFLDTGQTISQIRNQSLRADTAGTMQALVGLWQILCRQESIPAAESDAVFSGIVGAFAQVRSHRELFDAGRSGVRLLLKASGTPETASSQDRMLDLLAGAAETPDAESHTQMVQDMIRVFEAQRLVSLKTLFDLADHLERVSKGEKLDTALVNRLASRIAEIQLPRAALSTVEKNSFAFGYWTDRHIENQRKVNVRAAVERAAGDGQKLLDIRGQLAPFLRDTLVGFNYMHYAPPGAQVLYTNPLFVRSHDFLGIQGAQQTWRATEVFGTGWPSSAGGRLVGSLSGLPYALAEAEQNFLVPSREQALIWGDLVPQMMLSAKVPRWWNVTPAQLHWVGLHMRLGESLAAEASLSEDRRQKLTAILHRQAAPARVLRVERLLAAGKIQAALDTITPSELFVIAAETHRAEKQDSGPIAREMDNLARQAPDKINYAAISRAFGTPKPTLANSFRPELLNLRTFPTLMGYSSRIMAESWESNLLYYAGLADELHLMPSQLNVMVPEWTLKTVERIFATHLEDWPALLLSLRRVGDDVRAKTRQAGEQKAGLN